MKHNKVFGIILLNSILLLLCSGLIVAIFIPVVRMGKAFGAAQAGYEDGLLVIERARQKADASVKHCWFPPHNQNGKSKKMGGAREHANVYVIKIWGSKVLENMEN